MGEGGEITPRDWAKLRLTRFRDLERDPLEFVFYLQAENTETHFCDELGRRRNTIFFAREMGLPLLLEPSVRSLGEFIEDHLRAEFERAEAMPASLPTPPAGETPTEGPPVDWAKLARQEARFEHPLGLMSRALRAARLPELPRATPDDAAARWVATRDALARLRDELLDRVLQFPSAEAYVAWLRAGRPAAARATGPFMRPDYRAVHAALGEVTSDLMMAALPEAERASLYVARQSFLSEFAEWRRTLEGLVAALEAREAYDAAVAARVAERERARREVEERRERARARLYRALVGHFCGSAALARREPWSMREAFSWALVLEESGEFRNVRLQGDRPFIVHVYDEADAVCAELARALAEELGYGTAELRRAANVDVVALQLKGVFQSVFQSTNNQFTPLEMRWHMEREQADVVVSRDAAGAWVLRVGEVDRHPHVVQRAVPLSETAARLAEWRARLAALAPGPGETPAAVAARLQLWPLEVVDVALARGADGAWEPRGEAPAVSQAVLERGVAASELATRLAVWRQRLGGRELGDVTPAQAAAAMRETAPPPAPESTQLAVGLERGEPVVFEATIRDERRVRFAHDRAEAEGLAALMRDALRTGPARTVLEWRDLFDRRDDELRAAALAPFRAPAAGPLAPEAPPAPPPAPVENTPEAPTDEAPTDEAPVEEFAAPAGAPLCVGLTRDGRLSTDRAQTALVLLETRHAETHAHVVARLAESVFGKAYEPSRKRASAIAKPESGLHKFAADLQRSVAPDVDARASADAFFSRLA